MRRYAWFIAILLFIPSLFQGQELILKPIDELEDIRAIGMVAGLYGEIYIIDDQHLYMFDGYEKTQVLALGINTERLNSIEHLAGKIFIGTSAGKILRIANDRVDTLITYGKARINKILATADQALLIATDGEGVHRLDPISGLDTKLTLDLTLDYVNDIVLTNGKYFYATDYGLYSTTENLGQIENIKELGRKLISKMKVAGEDHLYMSDFGGDVLSLNLHDLVVKEIVIDDQVKISDMAYADGRLFLSANKGLYQISQLDAERVHVKLLDSGSSRSLLLDDECNLWVARERVIQRASLYFSRFKGLIDDEIHTMSFYDDKLLLGSEKGVSIWNPWTGEETLVDQGSNITCIELSNEYVAIGTYDSGLHIYQNIRKNPLILNKREGLRDNTVLALKNISDNEIIVSTLGGIDRLTKREGKWNSTILNEELDKYYILSIFLDYNESLWFGTDRKGVLHYKDGAITSLDTTKTGKKVGSVSSIRQRTDKSIWMISEELGLLRFSSSGLEEEKSPHGEWGSYTSLISLESNRFLLIGEREVCIYDPEKKELIEFGDELELERGTSFLNNFTVSGKDVYFEHNATMYLFHDIPDVKRTNSLTSLIRVEVDLARKDTSIHDFSEFENSFQFTYSGILHRNQKEIHYSYRLLGYEEEWRMTRDRQVAYSHLAPGEYTFQVRSSHDIYQSEADIVSYSFQIHQSFYRTVWFKMLIICSILGLIFWWRIRGMKAKEMRDKITLLSTESKLLNLKNQLNPHFLFNSFNTVIGLIEEDKERSVKYVQGLTDFYRSVLEIGDAELIPIAQEAKLLSAYCLLIEERFGEALQLQIPVSFGDFFVPPMSMQLLVENAVKHNIATESQPLLIVIQEYKNSIVVKNKINLRSSVKDSMGIGLENLKQRFRILARKELLVEIKDDFFVVVLPKIDVKEDLNEL